MRWADIPGTRYPPTLDEASVSELSVVLLPADGLPTIPISGSRGILEGVAGGGLAAGKRARERERDVSRGCSLGVIARSACKGICGNSLGTS